MLKDTNSRIISQILKQEKKIIFFTFLGLLAYAIFAFAIDLKKIYSIGLKFNWRLLPILILLSFANYLFRAIRFHYYLKQIKVNLPLKKSFIIFFSTLSMTLTPGKSGELIKAYFVQKYTSKRFFSVVPVVILERFMDGVAMLILGTFGIYFFLGDVPLFFFFSVLPLVGLYFIFHFRKQIIKKIERFEKRFKKIKLLEAVILFFSNSEQLIKPKIIISSLLISCLAWFIEATALYLLLSFFGFSGLKYLYFALFIFSFSSIAGFFALIPGGIGVAEGSILSFLIFFLNLDLATASFITLIFRIITLWFGVSLGITTFFSTQHFTTKRK